MSSVAGKRFNSIYGFVHFLSSRGIKSAAPLFHESLRNSIHEQLVATSHVGLDLGFRGAKQRGLWQEYVSKLQLHVILLLTNPLAVKCAHTLISVSIHTERWLRMGWRSPRCCGQVLNQLSCWRWFSVNHCARFKIPKWQWSSELIFEAFFILTIVRKHVTLWPFLLFLVALPQISC